MFLLATYTLSIPQLGTEDIGIALEWVFLILMPNFDLGSALMDMYTNSGFKDTCEGYNYNVICANLRGNATNGCCFPGNSHKLLQTCIFVQFGTGLLVWSDSDRPLSNYIICLDVFNLTPSARCGDRKKMSMLITNRVSDNFNYT